MSEFKFDLGGVSWFGRDSFRLWLLGFEADCSSRHLFYFERSFGRIWIDLFWIQVVDPYGGG